MIVLAIIFLKKKQEFIFFLCAPLLQSEGERNKREKGEI